MIISPPFLRRKDAAQSDTDWISAMMPVNAHRGYPVNASESWRGGIHISHTDAGATPEKVRAIADGTVVSFRSPSPPHKRDPFPLKSAPVRGTDNVDSREQRKKFSARLTPLWLTNVNISAHGKGSNER